MRTKLPSATTIPMYRLLHTSTLISTAAAAKCVGVPLTNVESGLIWAGNISIDTPPRKQKVAVDLDTGSSDLRVSASSFTDCADHDTTYRLVKSSTSVNKAGSLKIEYVDKSSPSENECFDAVDIAEVTITEPVLAQECEELKSDPVDGLLLTLSPIQNPFVFTAVAENVVQTDQFSFKFGAEGTKLYIDGTDTALHTDSIEFPVKVSHGAYALTGVSARIGIEEVASGMTSIIDSGTTLMVTSPSVVRAIYAQIPGAKRDRRRRATRECVQRIFLHQVRRGSKTWEVLE